MEAEVRDILKNTLKPEARVQMGDALANLSRRLGLTDGDIATIAQARDKSAAEPMTFE
jgi:plasmid stability protein